MKGTKGKEREINLADYLWVQCVVELGLEEKDKVQCVVKLGLPVKRHDGDAYFFLWQGLRQTVRGCGSRIHTSGRKTVFVLSCLFMAHTLLPSHWWTICGPSLQLERIQLGNQLWRTSLEVPGARGPPSINVTYKEREREKREIRDIKIIFNW